MKNQNKPEAGKTYALTGARGTSCIANGNSWAESEPRRTLPSTGTREKEERSYLRSRCREECVMKGVEEMDGKLDTRSLGRTNEGLVSFAIGLAPATGSLCHQLQEQLVEVVALYPVFILVSRSCALGYWTLRSRFSCCFLASLV